MPTDTDVKDEKAPVRPTATGAFRHNLTDKNIDAQTATCTVCGPDSPTYFFSNNYMYCASRQNERLRLNEKRRRDQQLRRLYGITLEQYENMLEEQDGRCGICEKPEKTNRLLSVDHCHDTLEVRGLLCGGCNRAIGALSDSVEGVEKALCYLKRHRSRSIPKYRPSQTSA